MSYDLFLWSTKPVKADNLPDKSSWKFFKDESEFQTEHWQVCVSNSIKVNKLKSDDKKASSKVKKHLPKVAYRTTVWLEPLGAGKEGYKKIGEVARYLMQQTDGLIEDRSNGQIETLEKDPMVISIIKKLLGLENKIRFI
ncbi:MAG: hypothetical protein HYW23_04590 [Candidatus Aenigmarchaeota archaeon]|nr:hypothetical protein [Candidatus Aenigmarchaeota archaeon]